MAGYTAEGSLEREEDARPFIVTCKRFMTESAQLGTRSTTTCTILRISPLQIYETAINRIEW